MLVTSMVTGRRRLWRGERPTEHLPEGMDDSIEVGVVDHSLLWPLVCALPHRQRAVIVLRFYEDMSEAQIADTLGCAPGTVKSQTSAAKAALRRALVAAGAGEVVGEP
jgi:DNA-directed RNA polymerase specialized sigma24 family protein